jgi:hypothetical protein
MSEAVRVRSVPCLLLLACVLTGCADGVVTAGPVRTPSPEPSASPPASEPASPTPSPSPAWQRCENPAERYGLSFPADWFVAEGAGIEPCTFFDDEPLALVPASEATGVAIRVDVRDVPLEQARRDSLAEGDKQAEERTVGSRRAVRVSGVLTEEVLLPAGTRITSWLVEDGARTILLHADDAAPGGYEAAVAVLDRMALSLEPA